MVSPIPSLKKRYFFKLITNFLGLFINLGTQVLIPRGLGPADYGNFNFLSNFFTQVMSFLDMGTSTAFYTKLSQRPEERDLVSFYWYFIFLVAGLVLLVPPLVWLVNLYPWLWPGQRGRHIVLAAGFGFLVWLNQVVSSMADAYGITVGIEKCKVAQRILGLALLAFLYLHGWLDLTSLFCASLALQGFLLIASGYLIRKKEHPFFPDLSLPRERLKLLWSEFYHYARPLFVLSVVVLVTGILDRWLLQTFAGSVQQGFFGLALQVSTVCFLFTSALTPLLLREFAIAAQRKDLARMAGLLNRALPGLSALATFFSCFLFFHADLVTRFLGGRNFAEASLPVALMIFYPILQTQGQILGAVLFACGETSFYSRVGIWFALIGLPVTFFLIAPAAWGGWAMGSAGLAIKSLALAFVGILVQYRFIAQRLDLHLARFVGVQFISLTVYLALAWSSRQCFTTVLPLNRLPGFLCGGLCYTLLAGLVFLLRPGLFGFDRDQVKDNLRGGIAWFQRRFR